MVVWVAAPRALWEHAGTVTLKAAGLETVEQAEARNTWFEILGQSLGVMARSHRRACSGREVTCDAGVERAADPRRSTTGRRSRCGSRTRSCRRWRSRSAPRLLSLLASPPAQRSRSAANRSAEAADAAPKRPPPRSRTMDLLLDVDLPVSISFGKTAARR